MVLTNLLSQRVKIIIKNINCYQEENNVVHDKVRQQIVMGLDKMWGMLSIMQGNFFSSEVYKF